jgi:hypothetical protein
LSSDPDGLVERTYQRIGVAAPDTHSFDGFLIQTQKAAALRDGLDRATAPQLLSDYAAERVEAIHDAIEFVGEYIGDVQRVGYVTEMDIVRLIYHTGDPGLSLVDMRKAKAPVTRAMIARWDRWPALMRATSGQSRRSVLWRIWKQSLKILGTRVREVDGMIQSRKRLGPRKVERCCIVSLIQNRWAACWGKAGCAIQECELPENLARGNRGRTTR